jgi:hypothetical protein
VKTTTTTTTINIFKMKRVLFCKAKYYKNIGAS